MEELSSAALRDCPGEEELVPVLGKERRFILQRGEKINNKNVLNKMPAGLSVQARVFNQLPVTYLSVQPALTLILVFLRRKKTAIFDRVIQQITEELKDKSQNILHLQASLQIQ